MAKKEKPLTVQIPRPTDEQPAWSRVGVIAAIGFVVGVAWPKIAGVKIGPSAPNEGKATTEVTAVTTTAPALAASAAQNAPPTTAEPASRNEQLVVVGQGSITRCSDKKDKKIDDCGKLQFDPVALPKLNELAKCPAALGLEGKLPIKFELNFEKKEVQVVKGTPKGKKDSLPSSTINGVLQCAAREFSNIALEDIPHKFRKYSVVYTLTFYPPGKHPETVQEDQKEGEEGEPSEGTTTSESEANGLATVSWDTALIRKEPKDGEIIARLVHGTRVKLLGRQKDWYKIEHRGKTGWVYRGAIGL